MQYRIEPPIARFSIMLLKKVGKLGKAVVLLLALAGSPTAFAQVVDDFSRPDGANIGNGWIEKNPAAFDLNAGAARKLNVSTGYRNNVVYRPQVEDLADVEASVQMRLTSTSPGYPQIFTRLQAANVANGDSLTGYILYVNNNPSQAILGRQVGNAFVTTLATVTINPALNTTDNYRLRLRSTGTNPVALSAFVERWNGTAWTVIGQATANDADAARVSLPGSVGFGGFVESTYRYDNFETLDLGAGANPQPVLNTINPTSATEGGSAFLLTVNGNGFVAGSVVRWNGADRATTYVSANQLQATITAADIAAAGTASVTVFSPAPGGGTSAAQTFTINAAPSDNPVPVLNTINPTSATEGGSAFLLTVNGNGFVAGSVVRWNGADRATTYVSANQLQATITAADIAAAGTASVTVFSPAPGGGTSAAQTFTINAAPSDNPVPVLNTINPTSATEGGSAFLLTVNGNGFVAGSVVRWNGADRATTYVSANQLQATITAADIAVAGTASVTVFSPAPGGGTSAAQTFTVDSGGPTGGFDFVDNFDRPNAASIGNGWIEKSPNAFDLNGNSVRKLPVSSGYRDNIVYRPAAEDVLDVEASMEFRLQNSSPGYPQLFTRVQASTVANAFTLDGYILYINNNLAEAVVGRQAGLNFLTTLGVIPISPALNTSDLFRMRLRTTGTSPVIVDAFIERWNGGAWETIGQTSVQDASAQRIATQGSVGFGGYTEATYTYDNFTRTTLGTGSNPVPALTSIAPNSATAGGSAFSLTVNGSGFVPGSVVRWNGADRATTYVSANQLQAAINSADIAAAGSASVTVFSPSPGGGTSTAQNFTINPDTGGNPVPVVTSINPTSATAGGSAFNLTVNGNNFVAGSVVRWNGADRATTFVSANQLRAAITAADIANAGNATVTVFTPAPGGGLSAGQTFTINPAGGNNPVPVLNSINPNSATEGGPGFNLTVNGSNFVAGSIVRWNGTNRTTTFVSGNQLRAAIPAADIANNGNATVTVFSPTPGGGVSGGQTFVIRNGSGGSPSLAIIDVSPESTITGSDAITLTILGSNFDNQSTVSLNGAPRATTFVSPTELRVNLSAADVSVAAANTLLVSTPAGGYSNPYPFLVVDPNSSYFFDNFNTSDSPDIGNNWTEKNPAAFSISNNEVVGIDTLPIVYRDNIVYRPAAEDRRDVELAIEFVRQDPLGFAQLHARATRDSITTPNLLESYILYIEDYLYPNGGLSFAIGPDMVDTGECIMRLVPFPFPLENGERYRMRFRVTGQYPVQLDGYLDWFDGTGWQEVISDTVIHDNNTPPDPFYCDPGTMPPPLQGAGASGFSKWADPPENYDNFYWIDLVGSAAVPSVSAITPEFVEEDGPAFSLLLNGANFTPATVVRWNGSDRPTTYVSPTAVQADIPASDITEPASIAISAFTPPPGGGISGTLTLEVYPAGQQSNPLPALQSLSPPYAAAGSGSTQISVIGTGFVNGSVVRWNGADRPTTFVSSTNLTATISAADLAAPGSALVSVFSPTPGGGTSGVREFAIVSSDEFFDSFDRPDNSVLGNGWIEKSPSAFRIQGNQLQKMSISSGYRDNVVYRPGAEAELNSETTLEVLISSASPGYPQIFTRLQTSTATQPGVLDGYILYIGDRLDRLELGRQTGSSFVNSLQTVWLNENLMVGQRYRMRLSASGTSPVVVSASIERLTATGYVQIGSATANDTSAQRIQSPGVAGFSGYIEGGTYTYDNFRARDLN